MVQEASEAARSRAAAGAPARPDPLDAIDAGLDLAPPC
jgi:hypothetical protein